MINVEMIPIYSKQQLLDHLKLNLYYELGNTVLPLEPTPYALYCKYTTHCNTWVMHIKDGVIFSNV